MKNNNQNLFSSLTTLKNSKECEDKNIAKVELSPLEIPLKSFNKKNTNPVDIHAWNHLLVSLKVIFGTKILSLEEISKIKEGDVIFLHELKDQPLEIYLNEIKVGYGEIVAIDEQFGIQFTHIIEK